jgi:hypothetical protein
MNSDRFGGIALAAPVTSQVSPAFVSCPVAVQNWAGGGCPWEQVYRIAYERACAVVRPSILERLQANLLN